MAGKVTYDRSRMVLLIMTTGVGSFAIDETSQMLC